MEINKQALEIAMANACITVKDLCVLADIRPQTFYALKRGDPTVYPRTVGKLARALGVPVETLLQEPKGYSA